MKKNIKFFTILATLLVATATVTSETASDVSAGTKNTWVPLRPHTKPGQDGSGTQKRFGQDGHGQQHLFGPGGQRQFLQDILTALQQSTPDVTGAISKIQDALNNLTSFEQNHTGTENTDASSQETQASSGNSDAASTDTHTGTSVQS